MRALIVLLTLAVSFLLRGPFADAATADAPNLDRNTSAKLALANYQLAPTTVLRVVAGEVVSHTAGTKQYFAFVGIDQEFACSPECLLPPLPLLQASAVFDTPPIHGGVNGAKLDVTLPVDFCALTSCPTTIEVSLVWEPDGPPTRGTTSTRTDTESCQFTEVNRFARANATVTGFVGYGTTNLASGEASGTLSDGSTRIVGFGDPAVCL